MNEPLKENKMGVMPVNQLLVSMAVPMILSMLMQAMYNIVDSIFVGRFDQNALSAVTMAFPAQSLMIAIAAGTGVGVNSLLSYSLGRKDSENANKAATHGIFLAFCAAIMFLVLGIFFSEPFYRWQISAKEWSENPDACRAIIAYGKDYLGVVTMFSLGIYMQVTLERLLQSTGKTFYAMITQTTGAIINIILDYIFVFGKCGLPAMGAKGAAIATVIGQWIAMTMAFVLNVKKNREISLSFKGFRVDGTVVKTIYRVGFPSIIMQAISSVVTFTLNKLLNGFSQVAVNAFGIYFKLQSFIFMPVFGLNNGMVPIIAYNYGARHKKRIFDTMKLSYLIAGSIMAAGMVVFLVLPRPLLSMFCKPENLDDLTRYGVPCLRLISLHFIVAAFSIITISVFQALGNGLYSMIVSICRQLVILLPVALFMGLVLKNIDLVWLSYPIAEIASASMCVFFLIRIYRKDLKKLPE
ncbi:MAG: MATE family efflux transporter [Lachnospiraceae bacterium]|nr:MATE family efflux transporter [Lachnospiraceae bacterium]